MTTFDFEDRLGRFGSFSSPGRGFVAHLRFASTISFQVFQVFVHSLNLGRTTIEVGAALNGKRLVVNIADYMSL